MNTFWEGLTANWEWSVFWPEVLGKAAGVTTGILLSWFLVIRRRVQAMRRLQRGDADDLLFQAHYLQTLLDGHFQLLFRNVAEKRTIEQVFTTRRRPRSCENWAMQRRSIIQSFRHLERSVLKSLTMPQAVVSSEPLLTRAAIDESGRASRRR